MLVKEQSDIFEIILTIGHSSVVRFANVIISLINPRFVPSKCRHIIKV